MKKKTVTLKSQLYSFLILFFFSTNIFSQANNYNCCITNFIRTSTTQMQFDVVIEWTGTNTQKLAFFQGGVNFNYAGIANGGTITGAFKPGSADPTLPGSQQSPTWNINQSSKQIRFFASIVSSSIAVPIASPPGFRLGTFIMTNTVPFTTNSSPNFVWSFSTGTSSTTKTQVSVYVNGATSATDVTIPPNHCVPSIFCGVSCSFANAGGPYSSCGDIHLNGSFAFASSAVWSTSGSGTFDPNNTALNAVYHPSNTDLLSGVTITLTTIEAPGPCSCGPASNSTQINFTSIDLLLWKN